MTPYTSVVVTQLAPPPPPPGAEKGDLRFSNPPGGDCR